MEKEELYYQGELVTNMKVLAGELGINTSYIYVLRKRGNCTLQEALDGYLERTKNQEVEGVRYSRVSDLAKHYKLNKEDLQRYIKCFEGDWGLAVRYLIPSKLTEQDEEVLKGYNFIKHRDKWFKKQSDVCNYFGYNVELFRRLKTDYGLTTDQSLEACLIDETHMQDGRVGNKKVGATSSFYFVMGVGVHQFLAKLITEGWTYEQGVEYYSKLKGASDKEKYLRHLQEEKDNAITYR